MRGLGLVLAVAATLCAAEPQPVATLSFTLFHNRVYVPVQVNGLKTFDMVLDTGAAVSGLSQASAQVLQLKTSGQAQLVGNGETRLKVALAKDVTLGVGAAELVEKSVAIIPFQDLESLEGRTIGGVLGVNLFRRYVVVIDYPARALTLYEPASFIYQGPGEVIPLRFKGGSARFSAGISIPGHDSMLAELALDSGAYSALRLYHPYTQRNGVQAETAVASFGFGLGGEFPEKLGRVAMLRIGSLTLNEPPTSFSEANSGATASDAHDGTIGDAILSRFKTIFDYPHHQIVLESNADSAKPFPVDTSGVILEASAPNFETIGVRHVLASSPAAAAGIREGDVLLALNDRDAEELGLEGIRLLFLNPGVYQLRIKRGQQLLDLNLTTEKALY